VVLLDEAGNRCRAPSLVIAGSSARGILGFRHRRRFPKN
jgi:hypothetical protein